MLKHKHQLENKTNKLVCQFFTRNSIYQPHLEGLHAYRRVMQACTEKPVVHAALAGFLLAGASRRTAAN